MVIHYFPLGADSSFYPKATLQRYPEDQNDKRDVTLAGSTSFMYGNELDVWDTSANL